MNRRGFLQSIGGVAAAMAAPHLAGAEPAGPVVLIKSARAPGHFPNISRSQCALTSRGLATLANARDATLLIRGRDRISVGKLDRARMAGAELGADSAVVGTRGRDLLLVRIDHQRRRKTTVRFGRLAAVHPATGLDAVWTSQGLIVVAPGPEARTLTLYAPEAKQPARVLAHHRWLHPLLAYDRKRSLLHLVLCPWNEFSSIYDTMYYMRSDDHGRTWTTADGAALELPLRPWPREHGDAAEPEIISVRGQSAGGESNTLAHGLELDGDGQVHLLYSFCRPYFIAVGPAMSEPVEPRMRTKHLCLAGNRWSVSELAPDFAWDVAGGTLTVESARKLHAVVMCKPKQGHWLDLGYTRSDNGGQTWSKIHPITTDAAQRESHYVAPSVAWQGSTLRYVCASLGARPVSAIYQGAVAV